MRILTVTDDFEDYKKGDQISDAAEMKAVLDGENVSKVVAINVPDTQTPKAAE
jgi:hypothetical protein